MPAAAAAARQWQALAPALAARGTMRLSHDGGRNYPLRAERSLTAAPPPVPAAVHIYDDDGATRLLAADFDIKRAAARGAADPAAQVSADAAAFAALVGSCGGRGFGDVSPTGGRHGYVLWAAPIAFSEARAIALALARRYPSLDPSPMLGRRHGIIRPPGSRHRTGGHQLLTTPLAHAERCAREPNGPAVWQRLGQALQPELDAAERPEPPPAEHAPAGTRQRADPAGMPWLPRPGGPVPRLRPDLEHAAATGAYDHRRYATPSEARYAILCSAAARGWQLADVTARLQAGHWPGLAGLFARYTPRQRPGSLAADWKKAVASADREKSGRQSHTRGIHHTGAPAPAAARETESSLFAGDYQQIRRWDCAVRAAEHEHGPSIARRLVLRSVGAAAQMTASMTVEFGTRALAVRCGLDHSTVARVLREIRGEDDPFLELLRPGRGLRADLYLLRIPERYAEAAAWRRWRAGPITIHPVFVILGGAAALVYEQLGPEPLRTTDVPIASGLSATTVSEALAGLASEGLADRVRTGWRRGPADPDDVAERLGAAALVQVVIARHQRERRAWRARLLRVLAPPTRLRRLVPDQAADHDSELVLAGTAARGPPARDDELLAVLEARLGPVQVIGATRSREPAGPRRAATPW